MINRIKSSMYSFDNQNVLKKGITEKIRFQSSNETSEAQLRANPEIFNNVSE